MLFGRFQWAAPLVCVVLTAPGSGLGLTMASAEPETYDENDSPSRAATDTAAAQNRLAEEEELARLACWQFLNKAMLVNKAGSFNSKCLKEVHDRWLGDLTDGTDQAISGQHCADFLVFAGGDEGLRLLLSELAKVPGEGFRNVFAPLNETVYAGTANHDSDERACPRAVWPRATGVNTGGGFDKRLDVAFFALYPGVVTVLLGLGVALAAMTRDPKPQFGKHVTVAAAAAIR